MYTCDLSIVASVDEVHARASDIILVGSCTGAVYDLYGLGKQLHFEDQVDTCTCKHLPGNATASDSSKLPIDLSIIQGLSLGGTGAHPMQLKIGVANKWAR